MSDGVLVALITSAAGIIGTGITLLVAPFVQARIDKQKELRQREDTLEAENDRLRIQNHLLRERFETFRNEVLRCLDTALFRLERIAQESDIAAQITQASHIVKLLEALKARLEQEVLPPLE